MCVLSYAFFLIDGVIFEIIYFYFLLFAFRFNFTQFIFIVLLSIIQCILFCLFIPYIYHDFLPQFQYNVVLKHLYSAFYCLIHILLLHFTSNFILPQSQYSSKTAGLSGERMLQGGAGSFSYGFQLFPTSTSTSTDSTADAKGMSYGHG